MHQSINDFDLAGINNHVNELKKAGLRVDFDLSESKAGIVRITCENWVARDGSEAMLEIHKMASRGGLFGKKSRWVVQLWSRTMGESEFSRRGCVTASTLVHAFTETALDMKYGFLSVLSLQDALAAG